MSSCDRCCVKIETNPRMTKPNERCVGKKAKVIDQKAITLGGFRLVTLRKKIVPYAVTFGQLPHYVKDTRRSIGYRRLG